MTIKEQLIARDMVDLIRNIEAHAGQLSSGERIPQLEFELIVAKIKSLYEQSVILKYLHANIDDIQNNVQSQECATGHGRKKKEAEELKEAEEIMPLIAAQASTPENREKKSLHEVLSATGTAKTLAEKLQEKSIASLSSSIALHEKLMFQKELFNGNAEGYSEMIKNLDSTGSMPDAKKFLEKNFYGKYSWEKKTEAYNALIAILEKRYGKSTLI